MNTRLLMAASAFWLGASGLLFSFLPEEILVYAGEQPAGTSAMMLQLLGAVYMGFAMLNWMAKGNLIGGVYSRPVAMGNLVHFVVAGLALLKAAFATPDAPAYWVAGGIFIVFAVLFWKVAFTHPLKQA
ncbi:hypothetical protein H7F15_13660 [Pontibacter sp. Tf4]|uniref:hypothetical protein n=1 Tax=Pontibacter sp. Tf4 TaxID=2761620 RepID=UPI001626D795|nr:hypothetical protein [Pontibacter sp. Tf4]MBB6612091.1 hypothetical protein [Pontibacter sp. Tf4]